MNNKCGIIVLILLSNFLVHKLCAQRTFQYEQEVPLTIKGKALPMPWAGGLNAAQYSTMDLNGDGQEDLVVFDRTANLLLPFVNNGNTYQAAPEYAAYFPEELDSWVLLRDFDCDGKKDLFTSTKFGVRVYRNVTPEDGTLEWEMYVSFLLTKGNSSTFNLKVGSADIPAIVDVDDDGDLDVVNFAFTGGAVEYHQNMSMEQMASCDTLIFQKNDGWGQIAECGCGTVSFNNEPCPPSRVMHFGGKSLLLLDADGDQDKDILFGEEACSQMLFMENEGTVLVESFSTARNDYPQAANPAFLTEFPAGYYEDVDFDGVPDLMLSPNLRENPGYVVDFQHSSYFYKNVGTTQNPAFEYQQNDYLQDQMLDLGEHAAPAFFDLDGDGDLDMLVGRTGKNGVASLLRFENIGTDQQPAFDWKEDDYLSVSTLEGQRIQPQFADLNADGKPDLILNVLEESKMTQQVYCFLQSEETRPFDTSDRQVLALDLGLEDFPLFEDVNQDGKTDLILGQQDGALNVFYNTAADFPPQLEAGETNFLGVEASAKRRRPVMATDDLDRDGATDLILADDNGYGKIFWSFKTDSVRTTEQVLLAGSDTLSLSSGSGAHLATARLFKEKYPAVFIGTRLGGMRVLRNSDAFSTTEEPLELKISGHIGDATIEVRVNKSAQVILYNMSGQKFFIKNIENRNDLIILDTRFFSAGVYILKALNEKGEQTAKRLVILK